MAAPEIVLYQYPGLSGKTTLSPPCAKVHMMLAAKGLDYRIVNLFSPAAVRRVNPRGRVPVLDVDGERIVDSSDILAELDRRFPEPPLVPADPRDAARARMVEDWFDEVLYFYGVWNRSVDPDNFARMKREVFSRMKPPLRWIAAWVFRRKATARTLGQGVGTKEPAAIQREFEGCLDTIATVLGDGPWIAGPRISHADLAAVAYLDQYLLDILTPNLAGAIRERPALVAWTARVHELAPNIAVRAAGA